LSETEVEEGVCASCYLYTKESVFENVQSVGENTESYHSLHSDR
jgi:hypothetical protein